MSVKMRIVQAIALVTSGLLLGGYATAANAYGTAFSCSSNVYQVVGNQLKLGTIDNTDNPSKVTYSAIGSAYSENYSAAGFNVIDNYVYALSTSEKLLRIDSVGAVSEVKAPGASTAVPTGLPQTPLTFTAGDTLPDGSALIAIATDHSVWSINIDTVVATKIGVLPSKPSQIDLGDIAIIKSGTTTTAYGIDTASGNLVSFDPTVATISVTTKTLANPIGAGKAKSGIVADSAGDLSVVVDQSGSFYGVYRPSTDAVVLQLATGPTLANNNGIKCANSPSLFKNRLPVAPGVPGTPTGTGGDTIVTLNFTAPLTGDPVTSYSVNVSPKAGTCVVDASTLTAVCSGLTNDSTYTFTVTATNNGGSATSASSDGVKAVKDPDVLPPEFDKDPPKALKCSGKAKYMATNDPTFLLACDRPKGVFISSATGVYTGYIEAKLSVNIAGTTYTCSTVFGQLKVIKIDKLTKTNAKKVAAQKKAAIASKKFPGIQYCTGKTKLDPLTTTPIGGMTPANFKKIRAIPKTTAELAQEKVVAGLLKGYSGRIDFTVIRYRAWPTTMVNLGDFNSKGGKIAIQSRKTSVIVN